MGWNGGGLLARARDAEVGIRYGRSGSVKGSPGNASAFPGLWGVRPIKAR